jgi:hypothetical protein
MHGRQERIRGPRPAGRRHVPQQNARDDEEGTRGGAGPSRRRESIFLKRPWSSTMRQAGGPGDRPGRNPRHYESLRWSLTKEVSDAEGYFRCKHGVLPKAGEHGENPLRYFGWRERFLAPFVERIRVTRLREIMARQNETGFVEVRMESDRRSNHDGDADPADNL